MLVTDRRRTRGRALSRAVAAAVEGGVGVVLIREPDLGSNELRTLVDTLRDALPNDTPLIVHGNPLVAREAGIGLHAASNGGLLDTGRGAFTRYGRTVIGEAQLERAMADRPDYLIVGDVFRRPQGMADLGRVCRISGRVPVFAGGEITLSRVPAVVRAGAHGIAVGRAILDDRRPADTARAFRLALEVADRARAARG